MKYYLPITSILKGLHVVDNDSEVAFSFEDASGKIIKQSISSIDGETVFNKIIGQNKDESPLPLYMKNNNQLYWYKILENDTLF